MGGRPPERAPEDEPQLYRPEGDYTRDLSGDDPGEATRRPPTPARRQGTGSESSGPGTAEETPTTEAPPEHEGGQPHGRR